MATIQRTGGRIIPSSGPRVMAAYDAVSTAVAAALRIQARPTDGLVSVGLAAGDVVWRGDDCAGAPIDAAVELASLAPAGQIIVSDTVRLLTDRPPHATYEPLDESGTAADPERPSGAMLLRATGSAEPDGSHGGEPPYARALATRWKTSFVGRRRAIDVLDDALARTWSGPGEAVLVGGNAGAGKTRLAAEFGRSAHLDGAAVLLGTCDADLALPYQPWVEAVRQLVVAQPDVSAVEGLSPLGRLITELEPATAPTPRDASSAAPPDPDLEQLQLFEAFGRALAEAAARWPTLVVLDDLHWAGTQTLALFRYLVRAGLPQGLLLIGTFRDLGAEVGTPLADCLAELHRHEAVTRLGLDDLDQSSVEDFIADAVGHELDEPLRALASDLWARSSGNAFYLVELWRHLGDAGAITYVDERWVVREHGAVTAVPDTVRDVVGARLASLTPLARRVVETAALAGQRFDANVVAQSIDVTADDLAVPLDELANIGFVGPLPGPALVYLFEHALVRDTVDAAISPIKRRRIHLALAGALERVQAGAQQPVLADLARHLVAAAPMAPIDKVVRCARRAAALALSAAAHDEASSHLLAVLALAPPDPDRTQLLIDLAECRLRGGLYQQSRDDSRSAFALAVDAGDAKLAAEAGLLFEQATHFPGLPGDPAVDLIRRAIDLTGTDRTPLRVRLEAALGRALAISGHAEALDVVEQAMEWARSIDDVDPLLVGLQAVITASNDPAAVLSAGSELERLARERGDTWNQAYGCANQSRARIALGDLDGATRDLARLRVHVAVGRQSMFEAMAFHLDVMLSLAAGDLARADAVAEEAMTQTATTTQHGEMGEGVYGVQLFAIRRAQGRLAEVAPVLALLERLPEQAGVWRPGLAAVYAELGMHDQAAAVFDQLAPDTFGAVPRDAMWPACLTYLAETCITLGDDAAAEILAAELQPFSGTNLTVAFTISFGPADRLIGDLLDISGRHDEADGAFADALDLAERSASPLWKAEVLFDQAAALAGRGQRAAAAVLQTEAETLAAGIGMAWRRVRRDLASTEPDQLSPLPGGLSEREADVLRLVAAGLSNRQIGERLFISQNTAANHVRAILRKTSCANRTEATSYAHHNGIVETGSRSLGGVTP